MLPIKRRFPPEDPFFEDGDILFTRLIRTVDEAVDSIAESLDAISINSFKCSVKGCSKIFTSPLLYNQHFDLLHRYVCHSCNRHLPSNHLLELHLMETHDTYFEACLDKGLEVYQCYLQSCRMKFVSEETRKKHLVDIHHYPADFKFSISKSKGYQIKKVTRKKDFNNKYESAMDVDLDIIADENKNVSSYCNDASIKNSNCIIDNGLPRNCISDNELPNQCAIDNELPRQHPIDKEITKQCQTDNELLREEKKIKKVTNDSAVFHNTKKTTGKLPKSVSFGRGRQRAFVK